MQPPPWSSLAAPRLMRRDVMTQHVEHAVTHKHRRSQVTVNSSERGHT